MFGRAQENTVLSYENAHIQSATNLEPSFGAKFSVPEVQKTLSQQNFGSSVQQKINNCRITDPVLANALELEVVNAYQTVNPLRMKNGYPSSLDSLHGNKYSVMYDYSRSVFPSHEVTEGVNDYRTILTNRAFNKQ